MEFYYFITKKSHKHIKINYKHKKLLHDVLYKTISCYVINNNIFVYKTIIDKDYSEGLIVYDYFEYSENIKIYHVGNTTFIKSSYNEQIIFNIISHFYFKSIFNFIYIIFLFHFLLKYYFQTINQL